MVHIMGHLDWAKGHPDKNMTSACVCLWERLPVETSIWTGRHSKADSPPRGGWVSNCGRPRWSTKWRDDLFSSCLSQLSVMKRHLQVSPAGSVSLENLTTGQPLNDVRRYKPFRSEFFSTQVLDVTSTFVIPLLPVLLLAFPRCSQQRVGGGKGRTLLSLGDNYWWPSGYRASLLGLHHKVPQTRWLR